MLLNKWDFKKHKYDKIEIKNYALPPLFLFDEEERLNIEVECINCRKKVIYGDTYTSRRYHSNIGLGYPVCKECYEQELKENEGIEEKSEADKMLEDLGYEKYLDNEFVIKYKNENNEVITFWREDKDVSKRNADGKGYLNPEEIEAIKKKCEELEWI